GPETSMKRLELLKEFMPRLTKFSLLWNASNPANVIYERDTGSAARALHVTMHSVPVTHPGQLEQAFATIEHERPNAMIVSGDLILQPHMERVIDFARRTHLPVMYQNSEQVKHGGLVAYGRQLCRPLSPGCRIHRQDSQRGQAGRAPRRAADEVRA